jgi:hypothetical protein
LYQESLAIRHEIGDKQGIAESFAGLAAVSSMQQQMVQATQLLGAVAALLESIGGSLETMERIVYDRALGAVQSALGDDHFAAAWAAGRALTVEQAVALALTIAE